MSTCRETISPHPSLSVTNVTSLPLNGCYGRELSLRKICTSPKERERALLVVITTNCFKTTFHFQFSINKSQPNIYVRSFYLTLTLSWIIRGVGGVTSDLHLTGLRPTENPLSCKERELQTFQPFNLSAFQLN